MKRFTTNEPDGNVSNALNLFFIKDKESWVRGYGPAPDCEDITLDKFVKGLCKIYSADIDTEQNLEDFSNEMAELLFFGPEDIEGLLAMLYTAGWAFSELREKLMAYEDTGLEPQEVKRIQEGIQCGRTVELPCKFGDTLFYIDLDCRIRKVTVETINCYAGNWSITAHTRKNSAYWVGFRISLDDFGKRAFYDEESARSALKMMQEDAEKWIPLHEPPEVENDG